MGAGRFTRWFYQLVTPYVYDNDADFAVSAAVPPGSVFIVLGSYTVPAGKLAVIQNIMVTVQATTAANQAIGYLLIARGTTTVRLLQVLSFAGTQQNQAFAPAQIPMLPGSVLEFRGTNSDVGPKGLACYCVISEIDL